MTRLALLGMAAAACSGVTRGEASDGGPGDAQISSGGSSGSSSGGASAGTGGSPSSGGSAGGTGAGGIASTGGTSSTGGASSTGGIASIDAGPPQCEGAETDCAGDVPRRCNDGRWDSLPRCAAPTSRCDDGACIEPNCLGLPRNCGNDQSCCETATVPGTAYPMGRSIVESAADFFPGGNADELPEHTATPLGFTLDVFEVTVARFRRFYDEYPGSKPSPGAGAHPAIPNSGWNPDWDSELPEDQSSLRITLLCSGRHTWSDEVIAADSDKPINCVNWYVAFAFCAWDGGYLPTEADWEAAAAGNTENRLYPWGPKEPDNTLAVFDCNFDGQFPCDWADIPVAGRVPDGRGRYGHHDLAGSMEEWVLDAYASDFYSNGTCTNCASLTGTQRVTRGGGWQTAADDVRVARRWARDPGESYETYGVRCAR